MDQLFLKTLMELPSVGTACGPVVSLLTERFGPHYRRTLTSDGYCLFQRADAPVEALRILFVSHMDEVGGCSYGARPAEAGGGYHCRFWGNRPEVFVDSTLQAFDYLDEDANHTFPVRGEVEAGEGLAESRMILYGEGVRPYRTAWTFREETAFDGDVVEGKALDPRATLYSVVETVRALDHPAVGALLVMAEECAMEVARKAVVYLQRHAPQLQLIANADVPERNNLGDARLDLPAIRIFEGREFIDPSFGIRTADLLQSKGVDLHLSSARSGSQTRLFTPLCPTLSIALPSDGIHQPRYRMSLRGIERCVTLLRAISETALAGEL